MKCHFECFDSGSIPSDLHGSGASVPHLMWRQWWDQDKVTRLLLDNINLEGGILPSVDLGEVILNFNIMAKPREPILGDDGSLFTFRHEPD